MKGRKFIEMFQVIKCDSLEQCPPESRKTWTFTRIILCVPIILRPEIIKYRVFDMAV